MNKTRLSYFEKEDILHLVISVEEESATVELQLSRGVLVTPIHSKAS